MTRRQEPSDENGDSLNGGAKSAALIRRAALWFSPIVIATAVLVRDSTNDARDTSDNRRDIARILERLERLDRDLADSLRLVDRDGVRDPGLRLAIDRRVAELVNGMNVLTKSWVLRLRDLNPTVKLPED